MHTNNTGNVAREDYLELERRYGVIRKETFKVPRQIFAIGFAHILWKRYPIILLVLALRVLPKIRLNETKFVTTFHERVLPLLNKCEQIFVSRINCLHRRDNSLDVQIIDGFHHNHIDMLEVVTTIRRSIQTNHSRGATRQARVSKKNF